MKKIILITACVALAGSITAQGGRIKISFAGFECYRETWDDILDSDGKGDEVFFNFAFTLADKNGSSKLSYEKRTPVYGDATGKYNNRINTGSCVDLFGNKRGGIKGGDTYRCNDLIGEYDMAEGDILTVFPTGWEQDPISDNSNAFMTTFKSFYNSINQKVAPLMAGFNVLTANLGAVVFNSVTLGISKINAGGNQGELGKPGTRPIGMEKFGDFAPESVVLNTPNLAIICSSDIGFGKGVIAVNYNEEKIGNPRDHGNYTILIKVEYTPNAAATNPSSYSSSVNPALIKQIKTAAANPFIGVWNGTFGTGQNNTPNFYSFRLNADGNLELLDINGNATAKGTYKIVNNQISGFYISANNVVVSFAGSISNNQLSGTWGNGTNTDNGGKWLMNKSTKSIGSNIR